MEEFHFIPIERPDDPERCQVVIPAKGQCNWKAVPGSKYCPAHAGPHQKHHDEADRLHNYRLARYQARVAKKAGCEAVKSLRDEVAILRMLTETILNACRTDSEIILQNGRLSDLITKIEKLVTSCDRLETKLAEVLDKDQLSKLMSQLGDILQRRVPNEFDLISSDLTDAINKLGNPTQEARRSIGNYDLGQFQARVTELASSDKLKSLRDEVAVLRMLVEERITSCRDSYDLCMQAGPIADLVVKVEKLVCSCERLEMKGGQVLDKTQITNLMQQAIEIIASHIEDADILEEIHDELVEVVSGMGG